MLDSTIISVCIKVFDWAKYKKEKGAIKLHTLLDYDGCMPKYVYMTEGKRADVKHANYMLIPSGSVIVADRAYIDFKMLFRWMKEGITFVMKLKDSIKYEQVWESSFGIAFLRMNLFVKILLTECLDNPFKPPEDLSMKNRQESLF